jgi:hypothetical protein
MHPCRQGQSDTSLRVLLLSQVDCTERVELWHRLSLKIFADKYNDDQIRYYQSNRNKGDKARTSQETISGSIATIRNSH